MIKTFSLQSMFTPNENAFDETPQPVLDNIVKSYQIISSTFANALREIYPIGDLALIIVPIDMTRVMMRISLRDQNVNDINDTPNNQDFIGKYLNNLKALMEDEDEIFISKDNNGYHVISFRAEDMIRVLKRATNNYLNRDNYWLALDVALKLKKEFDPQGFHARLN